MGVTIRAKKDPQKSIDLGYGGFRRLRAKVAELGGEPWASHYGSLAAALPSQRTSAFYKAFDAKTQELLDAKKVSIKMVDFCMQSDGGGAIRYGACKLLLKAIGDYDDEKLCYGYSGRLDCATFHDFKKILQECAMKKCDMVWF